MKKTTTLFKTNIRKFLIARTFNPQTDNRYRELCDLGHNSDYYFIRAKELLDSTKTQEPMHKFTTICTVIQLLVIWAMQIQQHEDHKSEASKTYKR